MYNHSRPQRAIHGLRGHRITSHGQYRRDPLASLRTLAARPEDDERADAGAWRHRAACRETATPVDMFPEDHHTGVDLEKAKAKALSICQGCPVVAECLNYALTYNETRGVWGATLPKERRELRRLLRDVAATVNAAAQAPDDPTPAEVDAA